MPDVIRHWVIRRGDGSAGNFLRVYHFNEHARPFVAVALNLVCKFRFWKIRVKYVFKHPPTSSTAGVSNSISSDCQFILREAVQF